MSTSVIQNAPLTKMRTDVEGAIVDPLQNGAWDSLLAGFPEATAFHTSAWARVLSRTYGHTPIYLRFDCADQSVALVPLMEVRSALTGVRGVCLPFTDFCGPLISDARFASAIPARLLQVAVERHWKHVELRGNESDLFLQAKIASTYYAHQLPLMATASELWEKLAGSVRRAIRKACSSGLSTEMTLAPDAIAEFYRLHTRTRRRHGVPPQPRRFFENIYNEMIRRGLGFLVLVRKGTKCVAAAMFFQFGSTAIYKFGASDLAARELRPSNLMIWEAIRLLAERGCALLHFGRTNLHDEGLRRFKLGWGTSESRLQYIRLGRGLLDTNSRNQNHAIANAFFQRMPLSVNRLAGAIIYPHLD
jgi:CelD/BcsL family acetyltransferase involved in cellulose biosynthesis